MYEDLAKANIADEKIKADIKNRGTNALIQGGVAGLQLGAQLQSAYAKSDKGKAKAAARAYEKAGKVGDRAEKLASAGKLTEQRAARLTARQNKLLEQAGPAYSTPGDLYSSPSGRQAENLAFEESMGRESAAKFPDKLMGNRGTRTADGKLVGYEAPKHKTTASHMADVSRMKAQGRQDLKLLQGLKDSNPELYEKMLQKHGDYLGGDERVDLTGIID